MITIKNLSAGYSETPVLNNINLNIKKSSFNAIIGPNGCGKTTLLKSIIRLIDSDGEILINNKNIAALSANDLAKQIAYISQNKNIPDISVERMVLNGRFPYLKYPRRYSKNDYRITNQQIDTLGLTSYRDKSMLKLSGGTQQKVFIAMALAQDTPIILMDEPTSFLDISHQIMLMELARELTKNNKTILMVLHDIRLAMKYCDNIILMSEGNVYSEGSPEYILARKDIDTVFNIDLTDYLSINK